MNILMSSPAFITSLGVSFVALCLQGKDGSLILCLSAMLPYFSFTVFHRIKYHSHCCAVYPLLQSVVLVAAAD